MIRTKRHPWTHAGVLLTVVALLVLAALRTADLKVRRDQVLASGDRRAARLARILDGYLRQTFAAADASLRQIVIHSQRIGGVEASREAWLPILRFAWAGLTGIGSLSVTDNAGIIRHSTRAEIVGEFRGANYVFRRLAQDTADVLVADTPMQTRFAPGRPIAIPLARRLTGSRGQFDGIVVATFVPDSLRRFFQHADVGAEGAVTILHVDGVVLIREPSNDDPIGESAAGNPVLEAALRSTETGFLRAALYPNAPMSRHAYRLLPDLRVAVAVSLSERELLAQWRSDVVMSVVVLTILGVMLAALQLVFFRRIRERAAAEQAALRSQRLESLGQLTGGVAHDFNNLLTVILGNVSLLKSLRPAGGSTEDEESLGDIERAAISASDLTHQLLAFARRQPLQPRVVDLNALVHKTRPMLARTIGEDITIRLNTAAAPCVCRVDPVQAESTIINLCLNARDAMPRGGLMVIETMRVQLDSTYAKQNPDVTPGPYVMVAVNDSGVGISPEHMARLFDPFFTTKEPGKGTGLGLSIVYGFVKQSGGHIKVYSEVGQGTAVKLYFPEETRPATPIDTPVVTEEPRGDGHVVLLVEDEPAVRTLGARLLEGLGYRVISAADGATALSIARKEARIDLLLTDIVLKGPMNGRQVAAALTKERPDLHVLYVSGYSADIILHRAQVEETLQLLPKPYDRRQLAIAVWAAINNR